MVLKRTIAPIITPKTDPPISPQKSYEILPAGEIWWEMKLEWGLVKLIKLKKSTRAWEKILSGVSLKSFFTFPSQIRQKMTHPHKIDQTWRFLEPENAWVISEIHELLGPRWPKMISERELVPWLGWFWVLIFFSPSTFQFGTIINHNFGSLWVDRYIDYGGRRWAP